jgi:TonB family protein
MFLLKVFGIQAVRLRYAASMFALLCLSALGPAIVAQTVSGDDVANWVKIYMNQREPTVAYSNITISNGNWKRGRLEKSIKGEVVAPCKVHITLHDSAVWNSSFEASDSYSEVRQCVLNLRGLPPSAITIQKLDANTTYSGNGLTGQVRATVSWLLEIADERRVDCNPVGTFNPKSAMAITYLNEQEANEAAKSLKLLVRNSCSSVDDTKRNSTAIAAEQSDQPLPWIDLANPIASLPVASVVAKKPEIVTLSADVTAGLLLNKTPPVYPPEAKAARVSGTVVLEGIISKTGSIENLRVISGPDMLRQAALDAVKTWRYKPYLLKGEPFEVVTTINVIFTLGG